MLVLRVESTKGSAIIPTCSKACAGIAHLLGLLQAHNANLSRLLLVLLLAWESHLSWLLLLGRLQAQDAHMLSWLLLLLLWISALELLLLLRLATATKLLRTTECSFRLLVLLLHWRDSLLVQVPLPQQATFRKTKEFHS